MIAALLAALALAAQDPVSAPTQPAPQSQDEPVQLDELVVDGRSLERLIGRFVNEVAEPNRGRGLARWDGGVCVGVANLQPEAAQYLADRISTVAEDLGLRAGAPGCTPQILVIATPDGEALARSMVERRRRSFRMGGTGMDRGGAALEDFQETDRPVRWWQVAMPVDSETGDRAVRMPGECDGACTRLTDYTPTVSVFSPSRMKTQIVDDLTRTVVIVDVDEVSEVSILQLADYIAMVSLAQVDPAADTQAYGSILNVFRDPTESPGLTDWDKAYLAGLYGAERNSSNRLANRQEVIDTIRAAHRRLRAADGEPATAAD